MATISFSDFTLTSDTSITWKAQSYKITPGTGKKLATLKLHYTARNGQGRTYINTKKSTSGALVNVYGNSSTTVSLPLSVSGTIYFGFDASVSGNSRAFTDLYITYTLEDAYTACTEPSEFSANTSSVYSGGEITLAWSGAASGTNNALTGYEIQYSKSSDGTTWSDWADPLSGGTITSAETSGSKIYQLDEIDAGISVGDRLKFRIKTTATMGSSYDSEWNAGDFTVKVIEAFEQQPVQTMPPYRTVHIWRRTE